MMIHTTIGVYANGEMKFNGVKAGNLINHIDYNLDFRPGRALFVNGKCVHKGYLNDEEVQKYEEMFKDPKFKLDKDTAPYI